MKKEELLEKAKESLKQEIIVPILSVLISALLSGWLVYINTKEDNRRTGCIQAVKSFEINSYRKKDLSILVDECKDEIKKYELLEDILYDSNNTDQFSSLINQLYVHNKIDEELITDFSDKSLMKNIQNENYNFDNTLGNTRNNLPTLDAQLTQYLQFTKEILFKSYSKEQQTNYFILLAYLFYNDQLFTNEYSSRQEKRSIDVQLDTRLLNLQKVIENTGKIDKRKWVVEGQNKFDNAIVELYNSYKNKDNKAVLINQLVMFSTEIEKNIKTNKSKMTEENQKKYINDFFNSERIIQLTLYELAKYKLDKKELETIFSEYIRIINYTYPFTKDRVNKLIAKLFIKNSMISITSNEELYRQLFLKNYQNKKITLNQELINYLAINKQVALLLDILKTSSKDAELKRQIFLAIIMSQQINSSNFPNVDYSDILIDLIKNEKNEELRRILLRDSLMTNSVNIIEYAIEYINENKSFYLKELDDCNYLGSDFYFMSIFRYLSDSKPSWIAKQQDIKKKKLDLFIDFMQKTQNKESKLRLIDNAINIIEKDDIFLIEQLREIIYKQSNLVLKQEMISKLTAIK